MSFFDDALGILGSVAPTIATALGGPFAGQAVQAAVSLFGLGEEASKDDLLQAVSKATPEQLAALRKIDADFAVQMKTLEVDLHRIHASDRDSARRREVDSGDNVTPRTLSVLSTLTFAACVGFVFWCVATGYPVDATWATLVGAVIGYAASNINVVYNYYFGSSSGSDSKNTLLARSMPTDMRGNKTDG